MSSEAKSTCPECGATILDATAARTGGLCMACKQGIRKNIERAKAHYQQQRTDHIHWRELVRRVTDTPDGFYRLSREEQTYFILRLFLGEVSNGGIGQFFDNSSGDYYQETLEALNELGAVQSHALLQAVGRVLFPDTDPPRDRTARLAAMPEYPDTPGVLRPNWDLELERISRELWSDPDKLSEKLHAYALDHGLVRI